MYRIPVKGERLIKSNSLKILHLIPILFFCLTLQFPTKGFSADFSINPIKIFFDSLNKTNILAINNESDEDLTLHLKAYTWEHNSKGKDIYAPTKDIIFFPKIVTIKSNEERIIRVGTKISQGKQEKTYRIFIEEIPGSSPTETTAVKIIMKVGVPIFIMPQKMDARGSIETLDIMQGELSVAVKNDGNIHFIVRSIKTEGIDEAGNSLFQNEIGGGYVHGSNSKNFTIKIPEDNCPKLKSINIDISTDRLSMSKKIDIDKEMCAP